MPKKVQLYLHIGHAKAGSTTLQAFMYENWAYLEAQGFALPTASLNVCDATHLPGNPLEALQEIRRKGDIGPVRSWIIEASKTHHKLLLSSECISAWIWHKFFLDLTDLVDIHLIYYVRRQDETLLAAWRQWGLKNGRPLDAFIQERLADTQPNYWANIAPWRNRVGLASMHVRFIGAKFLGGGDIQHDFANHLGLTFGKMRTVENQNTSLDARLLLFMSNRPEMFSSVHDDSIFELLREKDKDTSPMRLWLTEQQFADIYETFEDTNQLFLKEFDPANAGKPVIDPNTAPISDDNKEISEAETIAYVKNRLHKIPDITDARIAELKAELFIDGQP